VEVATHIRRFTTQGGLKVARTIPTRGALAEAAAEVNEAAAAAGDRRRTWPRDGHLVTALGPSEHWHWHEAELPVSAEKPKRRGKNKVEGDEDLPFDDPIERWEK
jgi:hypothetical protein